MVFNIIVIICLLISGLWFGIFGGRLLWQKGYVEKLREGKWKDKSNVPEEVGYRVDKYVMGGKYLGAGVLLTGAGLVLIYIILVR